MIVSVGLTNKKHSRFVIVENIYGFSYTLAETKNKPAAFFQAFPEVAISNLMFDLLRSHWDRFQFQFVYFCFFPFGIMNTKGMSLEFGAHFWKLFSEAY